jgi:hypothetical protein|tara:strand:- start:293 stop:469 length:177 start_codon:yes stop_codon:yes gene_type:complete
MRQNGVRSNVRFPYSKGSKKQTADDSLDESLGERRGAEATKTQSFKSRRDESRGASKV